MQDISSATNILPADFNDPFYQGGVYHFGVSCEKDAYTGQWHVAGQIRLSQGNTFGHQNFDGKTFEEVVKKIKAFIDGLPN